MWVGMWTRGRAGALACGCEWSWMRMSVKEEKNLLDHTDGCVHACMRGHMRVKETKKGLTGWGKWWTQHADMLRTDVLRADANECKKKRRRKKTYLEWGHADVNVLRVDANECKKKRKKKKKRTWTCKR